MRTTMLGFTGAGKTTYMASLYGSFSTGKSRKLRLRALDPKVGRSLDSLAAAIGQGLYPAFTNQRSEYRFALEAGDRNVEFAWSDYRGGAVADSSSEKDVAALLRELTGADGVMLFADAQELCAAGARKVKLGMLVDLLGRAVESATKKLSVSILLTKFDLVPRATERMLQPLQGLILAAEASRKIDAALIPVVCGPKPMNVGHPLFFSLHHSLRHHASEWEAEHERRAVKARELERKAAQQGLFGDLIDLAAKVFFDDPTVYEQAHASREEAAAGFGQLTTFQTIRSAVDRELANICRIRRGKTLDLYWHEVLRAAGRTSASSGSNRKSAYEWH